MGKLAIAACLTLAFLAVTVAQPSGRIVGGIVATEGQFPHQISLRIDNTHNCGGSIISQNYVLTAAHCVGYTDGKGVYHVYPPSILTVHAGSNNRRIGGVFRPVTTITVHENYGNFINDVALLKLKSPLVYSATVRPIPLASSEVAPGSKVIISGWGRVKTGGVSPVELQYTTLEAISQLRCFTSIFVSSNALICLAHQVGNGACNGDSGGPAILNGKLVGVAGFVVGGCGTSNPDGYAKVSYHRNWIIAHSDL